MRSRLRLPTGTCRASGCPLGSFSTPRSTIYTSSTPASAGTTSRRFSLPSAMRFSERWSRSFRPASCSASETRSPSASDSSSRKGPRISISSLIIWRSLTWLSGRSICKPSRVFLGWFREASGPAVGRKGQVRGGPGERAQEEHHNQSLGLSEVDRAGGPGLQEQPL